MADKQFISTIIISEDTDQFIRLHLNMEPPDENYCFGEDDVYEESVTFENGYTMSIQMCGVKYEDDSDNTAWTQAVLYDENGVEICCTDPCAEFTGRWTLNANDCEFVVYVTVATKDKLASLKKNNKQ